ncbi:MAG: patatin-like phospholipase family protein [Amoebophilaceae bacterium]|nr:patatin-like phospholipase family protein [Amoebophilaceae bacterium]
MKNHIENLVFAGGGVLGAAFIGSLEAIDEKVQSLHAIKQFIGTSVGSILAIFSALRYTTTEIKEIMLDLDFKKLADQGIYTLNFDTFSITGIYEDIKDIYKLIRNERGNFGLNSGHFLENWIEGIIAKKLGKKQATFADLHNNPTMGLLHITGSNFSEHKSEVYNVENTPHMVISRAVRISTSVPILFGVVKEGNIIKVDGGVYNNFPMELFSDAENRKTIGLNFSTSLTHHLAKHHKITVENMDQFVWEKYMAA